MIIPSDLNDIQPRATQVWNCDEVGFDPNGRWSKVICTYKFFQGEQKWKVKTGERSSFWCTLLVFTQADGECFTPPIIVHRYKEYSQDLHYNIPLDWIIHHTPYSYIYRDGWLKAMTQLSNIFCASPFNNHILLFDGHESHFDDDALRQMMCKNIQRFVQNQANPSTTSPMIIAQISNWILSTTWKRVRGCWSMERKSFQLTTWTPYWLNNGMTSRCKRATPSGTDLQKQRYPPPPHPSQINNKYPGMCCFHPSILWIQGWINKQYITPDSCTYQVIGQQDWWYYDFPPRNAYGTIIK